QSRGSDPLQRVSQLDTTFRGEMPEMVVTHRNVGGVAHGFLNRSDVVGYEFTSLIAELQSLIVILGAFPRFTVIAFRRKHRAPLALEDASYAQVHFEHRKP